MKQKLAMLLGLLMIASLVLTACGGGAAPTEAPAEPTEAPATEAPEPTEAPATEPPAAEPAGTLRIWADDTRAPILQDLADEVLATYNLSWS